MRIENCELRKPKERRAQSVPRIADRLPLMMIINNRGPAQGKEHKNAGKHPIGTARKTPDSRPMEMVMSRSETPPDKQKRRQTSRCPDIISDSGECQCGWTLGEELCSSRSSWKSSLEIMEV